MNKIGERIKQLRQDTGLSQQQFADMLNKINSELKLSRVTISKIENGERDILAKEITAMAKLFNTTVENIYNLESKLKVNLIENTRVEKKKEDIRIDVPQKNIEKFKEVLIYLLNKIGSKENIGETVVYKLLYFIDFDFYEKYEEQLIGATYIKNLYGPTPVEFKKIIGKMITNKEIEKVQSKYFNYPQTKYLPLRKPDLSKLKANELELINNVIDKLGDMNANEISDYSHKDVPWSVAKDGDIIKYESVFYRTKPYSVREYSDEF